MPARQPAGTPSGGQFATTGRRETEVELHGAHRVVDEALHLVAQEVLETHPQARYLALQELEGEPEPLVVAYVAMDDDGQMLWLDPDVTDTVHGYLAPLAGIEDARRTGLLADVEASGSMAALDLHRAAAGNPAAAA